MARSALLLLLGIAAVSAASAAGEVRALPACQLTRWRRRHCVRARAWLSSTFFCEWCLTLLLAARRSLLAEAFHNPLSTQAVTLKDEVRSLFSQWASKFGRTYAAGEAVRSRCCAARGCLSLVAGMGK